MAEASYNPLIPPKPLPIIVDLILHAKLIFTGLKKMGMELNPENWCRGPDLNQGRLEKSPAKPSFFFHFMF